MRDPSEVIAEMRRAAAFQREVGTAVARCQADALERWANDLEATPQPASADVDDAFVRAVWENLPSASNVCDEISLSQVRYALKEALAASKGDSHAG